MLCRVAENLFWMSRYVERAIWVGRLFDVTWHLELDAGDPAADDVDFWRPLLSQAADQPHQGSNGQLPMSPRDFRHFMAFDPENPNSLITCIRRAREAARHVRESISSEMWLQLNRLYLSLTGPRLSTSAEEEPDAFYGPVREGAQFFQGLADSTLARDESWHFVTFGKFLERADDVARVLLLERHLLASGGQASVDDTVRWLALLRSCGCAEAYVRYYSLRVEPARVVEFLLLNPIFPQSVRFSLRAALEALREIAGAGEGRDDGSSRAVRALGLLHARLEHSAVDEILEEGLESYLLEVQTRVAQVSDHVTISYLRDEPLAPRLMPVARAAEIMAAQQQ